MTTRPLYACSRRQRVDRERLIHRIRVALFLVFLLVVVTGAINLALSALETITLFQH